MKKTLITLAALAMASVASADVTDVYTSEQLEAFNTNGTLTLTNAITFDYDWTLSATVDLKGSYTSQANFWGGAALSTGNNAGSSNVLFRLWQPDGSHSWRETVYNLNGGSDSTFGTNPSIRFSGETDISLSYDASEQLFTVTIAGQYQTSNAEDAELTPYTGTLTATIPNTYAAITTLSTSTNDSNSVTALSYTSAVPEPATATLSLLALAGLAARRRRK